MIGLAFLGVVLLLAGTGLWVALDAARFNRRNQYGTMLFQTYGSALAFNIGQRIGGPLAKALLIAGGAALFASVMAGPA